MGFYSGFSTRSSTHRDANSPAILVPRGFGESGNRGMAISYSLEIGETKSYFLGFRGISGIVFPLDEQSLVHNQHYTLHSFMFYQQHVIEMSTC